MTTSSPPRPITDSDTFVRRHVSPSAAEVQAMLEVLGYGSLDAFIDAVVPAGIRLRTPLRIGASRSEHDVLNEIAGIASKNAVFRSYLGMGFYDTLVPPVIQRNILENPGWYTAYTPYQAEIAQGRMEALLVYQTMVRDLTGMEIANASLLDEATAVAEGVSLAHAVGNDDAKDTILVAADCHPQNIDVVKTRASVRGWKVVVGDVRQEALDPKVFAVVVQYPATDGGIHDYRELADRAHAAGALVIAATDLLALALLTPPGEWGADVAVGNSQRFGVPMGYGGPHAAFFATKEAYKRAMPGRIIGMSRDARGKPAMRMALGTREQHIRREKATSNICTAQVLLAVMAGMYAVWHGPEGITRIARRVHRFAALLAAGAESQGHRVVHNEFFDTVAIELTGLTADAALAAARERRINLRKLSSTTISIALDETVTEADLAEVIAALHNGRSEFTVVGVSGDVDSRYDERFARTSAFLTHPVFSMYHAEHEMLRYIRTLESRDLSLVHSMISLGSCTMKLNATAEMFPVTWPAFGRLHPFAPAEQAQGYRVLFETLEQDLAEITGFAAVSLQPNAGSQGEYAGLL
ncbi:MAG TPA: glycine dehydrogenase (aminomethyl-transferring), partial [Gemmatimonadaceae bacterium]|nr:glycine dehydrogenase (aminomethyl-transferring) [Gemmatimonadaceae bacterium]